MTGGSLASVMETVVDSESVRPVESSATTSNVTTGCSSKSSGPATEITPVTASISKPEPAPPERENVAESPASSSEVVMGLEMAVPMVATSDAVSEPGIEKEGGSATSFTVT